MIKVGDCYKINSNLASAPYLVPFVTKYQRGLDKITAIVCFVDDNRISVMIQGVPGYYGSIVSMPRGNFSSWFIPIGKNLGKQYDVKNHSDKEFPKYFM